MEEACGVCGVCVEEACGGPGWWDVHVGGESACVGGQADVCGGQAGRQGSACVWGCKLGVRVAGALLGYKAQMPPGHSGDRQAPQGSWLDPISHPHSPPSSNCQPMRVWREGVWPSGTLLGLW